VNEEHEKPEEHSVENLEDDDMDVKGSRGLSRRDVRNIYEAYKKGREELRKVMREIWSRPEANPRLSREEAEKVRQEYLDSCAPD
jgi:DNA-binding PadR family transcriptional regulator